MGKFEEPVPNKIDKIKPENGEGKQNKLNGFGIAAKHLMEGNKQATLSVDSAVQSGVETNQPAKPSADNSPNSGVEIFHKDGKGDDIKVNASPEIFHKDGKNNIQVEAGPEIFHKDGKGDDVKSLNVSSEGSKNGIDAVASHPDGPEAGLKKQSEDFKKKYEKASNLPPDKAIQAFESLYKDNQAQIKQVELKIASITKALAETTFMPF